MASQASSADCVCDSNTNAEPAVHNEPVADAKVNNAEPMNETVAATRKRARSVGGEPPSPESIIAITECSKKAKSKQLEAAASVDKPASVRPKKQPGASKTTYFRESCVFCNKEGTYLNMIQCNECEQFYHLDCCSVPVDKHEATIAVINLLGWMCQACRFDNRRRFKLLMDEMAAMRLQIAHLIDINQKDNVSTDKSEFPPLAADKTSLSGIRPASNTIAHHGAGVASQHSSMPIQYADVVRVVGKTVRDVNRRRCNVIISGLSETGTKDKDVECVSNMARDVLYMDLNASIVTCKRIGKEVPSHPRRLLVTLVSEATAEEILRRAPRIRYIDNEYMANNLYINRDLTPDEALEAFLLRKKRREQRQVSAGDRRGIEVESDETTVGPTVCSNQRDEHGGASGGEVVRDGTTNGQTVDLNQRDMYEGVRDGGCPGGYDVYAETRGGGSSGGHDLYAEARGGGGAGGRGMYAGARGGSDAGVRSASATFNPNQRDTHRVDRVFHRYSHSSRPVVDERFSLPLSNRFSAFDAPSDTVHIYSASRVDDVLSSGPINARVNPTKNPNNVPPVEGRPRPSVS